MARSWFGGTSNDLVLGRFPFGTTVLLAENNSTKKITFWDAQVDGNQYTDLLDTNGLPITSLVVEGYQAQRFQGPDGITAMWADDGDGERALLEARDLAAIASAQASVSADRTATEAARDEAVASNNNKVPIADLYGTGTTVLPAKLPTALYKAVGGDETVALNSFLAATTPGVKQLVGDLSISDYLTVPAGVVVDASKAKITQTSANTISVVLGDKATWRGGEIVGLGTDYVSGGSPLAIGIHTDGSTGARVQGVTFTNISGASVRGYNVTDFRVSDCRIVGVGAAITSGVGSPCFGVLIDQTSVGVTINNCDISQTCQGIITGLSTTHISVKGTQIHDIKGQHGCYIQNPTGLNVAGLDLWNIPLNGLKVQMADTSAADTLGITITGVTANNCGDSGVTLNNTAANLTSAKKMRAVTIAGVSAVNCLRGIYIGSVHGGTITGVSIYNATQDAITFLDCKNIEGASLVVDTCGRVGLRLTSATGSVMDRISLAGVRIHNAANANTASNIYGVYHAQGSNVTLDRLQITATNGFMQYGYFLASGTAGDQNTFALRNADLSGDTGTSARFQATVTGVKDWSNNRFSGTILNKPNAVTAVVAVP